ncbi:transcriptional regulator [Streptomyces sp. CBMA156]|uniref:transcriptional regulator n=1 Tax=Streptomyces sp. CBMA156 TaxID=1930280 RepID=UPI001CB7E9E5|nr:transcriptional regulator [Streptomyces sp. CBMA156]
MRRRNLLLLGVAATASLAVPQAAAAGSAQAGSADPADNLVGLLYTPPAPVSGTSLPQLDRLLAATRAQFTASHYRDLGAALPGLIATAEAHRDSSSGGARERAHTLAARGYVLATELAAKHHSDLAWATADRAVQAARQSGDPVVIGEAVRVLAITMRRAGRPGAAVALLERTARDLDDHGPAARAVAASLWMTAAYTAACAHDAGSAHDLLTGAAEAVDRLPVGLPRQRLFTVEATPTQVDLYRVGVHTVLGEPDQAVPHATRINPAALPTAERQARWGTDTARMWMRLGDQQRTLAALRFVDRVAPEEARRPALQALTSELLYTAMPAAGVRDFARRTGVLT